jgi:hypothetical protein
METALNCKEAKVLPQAFKNLDSDCRDRACILTRSNDTLVT